MKQQTVTINGNVYDSHTGQLLQAERKSAAAIHHSAHTVHTQQQRSTTLSRRHVRREAAKQQLETEQQAAINTRKKATHAISIHKAPAKSEVKRSETVVRFAPSVAPRVAHSADSKHAKPDVRPTVHPLVQRVEQQRAATSQQVTKAIKPSHIIKREAIEAATAKMPAKHTRKEVSQRKPHAKFSRFVSLASASLAVLVLGGYLTYLNMPALSTRVAATQAGIEATYPSYQPMGYNLSGPVAYEEGSVSMKFAANGGPEDYTLAQTKSGWDSSAVLEYYVLPKAGQNYTTTTTNGLTIYGYGDNAVWVNNGILYTIEGNATLSNSQIQRIATSL